MSNTISRTKRSIGCTGLVALTLYVLTGCSHATTPNPPTAIIAPFSDQIPLTLPPTWTIVPTITAMPTSTPYPTATALPTLTLDQLCQNFHLIATPAANALIAYDGQASFTWTGLAADATMTLQMTIQGGKAGLRADIVTPGDGSVAVPMLQLPQEGVYDWRLWVQSVAHPEAGQLCVHSGTIIRQPLLMM